ncbi:MAG: NYN domain-containing protein [Ardenticatenaceae bacterium]|nr:NYN domain-containing protein [Ardenticatenaceae bacterium]
MIYLIDGHNLIGKMPDIDLADPDDEEKLIGKLRDWARQSQKRTVHVYFDPGSLGGFGNLMGGSGIKVEFARMGQIADDLLIKKLRQIRNPQEYTLVTSDRAILDAARKKRVGYILSEEFAALLGEDLSGKAEVEETDQPADPGEGEEVDLSADELQQWLAVFDKAPRPQRPQPKPVESKKTGPVKAQKPALPPATIDELKEGIGLMSDHDVAEWLTLFEKEERPPSPQQNDQPQPPQKAKRPLRKKPIKNQVNPSPDQKYDGLSSDEIDDWLDLFERGENDE